MLRTKWRVSTLADGQIFVTGANTDSPSLLGAVVWLSPDDAVALARELVRLADEGRMLADDWREAYPWPGLGTRESAIIRRELGPGTAKEMTERLLSTPREAIAGWRGCGPALTDTIWKYVAECLSRRPHPARAIDPR